MNVTCNSTLTLSTFLEVHLKSSCFTTAFTEAQSTHRAVWAVAKQCTGHGCNKANPVFLMRTAGGKQMAPGAQHKALT